MTPPPVSLDCAAIRPLVADETSGGVTPPPVSLDCAAIRPLVADETSGGVKVNGILREEGGFVLTATIVFIMMLVFLAAFVLNAGYNQRVMANNVGVTRAKAYYRAQAGVVDANARIRTNYVTGLGVGTGSSGTSFLDSGYNPAPYHLDLDQNPPTFSNAASIPTGYDVTVDISAVDRNNDGTAVSPLTGRRIIEVTGEDRG